MKLTVFERSTGEKRVEKWLFKPDDSKITILRKFRLEENTVGFFILDSNYKEFTKSDAQYLFLNLATRKHFRVRRSDVVSQINRKTAGSDFDGFRIKSLQIVNMHAENSLAKIRFQMTLRQIGVSRALSKIKKIPEFNITIG